MFCLPRLLFKLAIRNPKSEIHAAKEWLFVLGWCGVIFFLSSLPDPTPDVQEWLKFSMAKCGHVVVYFVLSLFVLRALKKTFPASPRHGWLALLFCALYGVSDEVHQSFVPGRSAMLWDVLLDSFSAYAGIKLSSIRRQAIGNKRE